MNQSTSASSKWQLGTCNMKKDVVSIPIQFSSSKLYKLQLPIAGVQVMFDVKVVQFDVWLNNFKFSILYPERCTWRHNICQSGSSLQENLYLWSTHEKSTVRMGSWKSNNNNRKNELQKMNQKDEEKWKKIKKRCRRRRTRAGLSFHFILMCLTSIFYSFIRIWVYASSTSCRKINKMIFHWETVRPTMMTVNQKKVNKHWFFCLPLLLLSLPLSPNPKNKKIDGKWKE